MLMPPPPKPPRDREPDHEGAGPALQLLVTLEFGLAMAVLGAIVGAAVRAAVLPTAIWPLQLGALLGLLSCVPIGVQIVRGELPDDFWE
ncbi:MAG TPA: hypothetical protein VK906_10270 [Egicoccus sp.]|nr:hypothetical protein [Egicoccus sp.]HSK23553.1 hypothetical protein [Egicoccus sp.]